MALGYLLDPFMQLCDGDGKVISGAKISVYKGNSTEPANTYSDFSGTLNPWPVITDSLGSAVILVEESEYYNVIIKDANGNLMFSRPRMVVNHIEAGEVINNIVSVEGSEDILVSSVHPSPNSTKYNVYLRFNNIYRKVEVDQKLSEYLKKTRAGGLNKPIYIDEDGTAKECNGRTFTSEDEEKLDSLDPEQLVHKAGEEVITGPKMFTNDIQISGMNGTDGTELIRQESWEDLPWACFARSYYDAQGRSIIGTYLETYAPVVKRLSELPVSDTDAAVVYSEGLFSIGMYIDNQGNARLTLRINQVNNSTMTITTIASGASTVGTTEILSLEERNYQIPTNLSISSRYNRVVMMYDYGIHNYLKEFELFFYRTENSSSSSAFNVLFRRVR